jgi:hypothetical protein
MALSDRERRLLAEMEAALASDDPRLQSTLSSGDTATILRGKSSSLIKAAALVLIGIATLFSGLISQIPLIGIAGFLVTLTGLVVAIRSLSAPIQGAVRQGKGSSKSPRGGGLSARLQERWDRRTFE